MSIDGNSTGSPVAPCFHAAVVVTEYLQPYKPRPETSASVARNLVAGALGLQTRVSKEQRELERQKLKQARGESPWASTPYKRWSKCTMEKVGGRFLQKFYTGN